MMLIRSTLAAALLLLAATAGVAHAGQSQSVTDFDGRYALTCTRASFVFHLGLTGQIGGHSASWNDQLVIDVPCEAGSDDAIAAAAEAGARCAAAGLPASVCGELEAVVAEAIDGTAALVPDAVALRVTNAWDLWARLFGVYNVAGVHDFDNGAQVGWSYLLDNNDGNRGKIGTLGFAVLDAAAQGIAGCLDTAAGGIDGRIDAARGYALSATFAVDRSLTCAAGQGGDWALVNVGLSFRGAVTGARE